MIQTPFIEELICEYLNRRFCFLVGRGATAIYLALKAIETKVGRGEVILPTISCTSPAKVVYYAGFKPVFADVTLSDFTIDVESLKARISEETKAILPVHIFGHCAAMNEILEIAAERELYVIEDAAQALGGCCGDTKIGSMGDFSILSFGRAKIIEAGGGGAIVTDNEEFASMINEEIDRLPHGGTSLKYAIKSLSYRNFYHSMVGLLRVDQSITLNDVFMATIPFYKDVYLYRFSRNEEMLKNISDGFRNLKRNNELRIERAKLYNDLLSSEGLVRPIDWEKSGVVWRYSFLVRNLEKLNIITERLRENSIHASNLYWSVADLFYNEKAYCNTGHICPRILNLWVDANADRAYIQKSCDIVLENLK